jgi:hypothetical protein
MTPGIITEKELGQMRWRLRLGVIVFVIGFLSPLLIPLVTASELPTKWKAVISGFLAVGIPELFSIIAIAIMGKPGFNYIKKQFFAFLKKHGPPDKVNRMRYRIGLVMFLIPIFFGWLAPYFPHTVPGYETHRFWVNLIGDMMFVSSLFVLGGDFWDKVRALFVYGATAKFPEPLSN